MASNVDTGGVTIVVQLSVSNAESDASSPML
jgi:hypothetical protein